MMKKYYYLNSAQQQMGPIYAEDFVRLGLDGNTFVWCEGMPNWTKANQVPELLSYISNSTSSTFGPATPPNFNGGAPAGNPYGNNGSSYKGMNNTPPPSPCPDNYLVWSILTTLLCCWPLGVVAIVKAAKVEKLWSQGFYAEAEGMSRDAKKWCVISAVASVVFWILYFFLVVGLAAMGAM